jgi:iturin family lipopeptide synthetase A
MQDQPKTTGFEVAVVGLAARFPGARTVDEFWRNLEEGVESVAFFNEAELDGVDIDPRWLENPHFVPCKGGHLEEGEWFDHSFFGYTPAEAEIMDPQVRLFHQCAWEALENAGYDPFTYRGAIGLYAGSASSTEWEALALLSGKADDLGMFAARQLTDRDFMVSRVAYKLNLTGPAVTVQTACSTSLVAIHLACRALLLGECDMALAGGVTVTAKYRAGYLYQEGLVNSVDGHCRAFDAGASGFVGGSGAGVVVLKRLKHAAAHGDHIYGVVKGSAVNNDGVRRLGYSAPSVEGQVEVIRKALRIGGVEAESLTYVETHGTGTVLGDPVEVEALKQAFNSAQRGFCAIGSVKTNVGHLDAAAGVAGFIKTVLALNHRLIPPSLHFETPNPQIDFENSPFYVNRQLRAWRSESLPLRAGVSSFGIGGTNAHVILEEYRSVGGADLRPSKERPHLVLLSAQSVGALEQMSHNLAAFLKRNPGIDLGDTAYTLQVGRRAFKYRQKLVCTTIDQAAEALSPPGSRQLRRETAGEGRPVIFMFSGLGAQYVNMGRGLYDGQPVFRRRLDRCFEILQPLLGYDIKEILYPEQGGGGHDAALKARLNRSETAQLLIFIFEYALAGLLMEWGIRPKAMIGYSFGEYTAAALAGVFSLEDALRLVVSRGKLVRQTVEGRMLSVPLPESTLRPLLNEALSLAIDNGDSCIVAGAAAVVTEFERQMKARRCLCLPLEADRAIHSHLMEAVTDQWTTVLRQVRLNRPLIPYISNVTGGWIGADEAADPGYWARHLRRTVRFADGMRELAKQEGALFVEIGPARDLNALVRRYIEENPRQAVVSLVRHPDTAVGDEHYLLGKIGELWLRGVPIDWQAYYKEEKCRRLPLPTYPFNEHRFRLDGDPAALAARLASGRGTAGAETDLTDWFYLPVWKQAPLLTTGTLQGGSESGRWLLFMDEVGLGALLAKQLREAGQPVAIVTAGRGFEKQSETAYAVDPGKRRDYELLIGALHPDHIVHLWGVDDTGGLDAGFYSLLYLAQAVGTAHISTDIKLTVVTADMQDINGSEDLRPGKAVVLGPVKVIPQEYPHIRCRSIDVSLPPGGGDSERLAAQLWEELRVEGGDTLVGYRGSRRWQRTFEPLPLKRSLEKRAPLKERGVYLVTGGLGRIGSILAESLARDYRARLVLTGRSAAGAKKKRLQELEEMGAEVLIIAADAADLPAMARVMEQAEARFGRIDGVIHAAGLIHGPSIRPIREINKDDCERQFRAKIGGLAVLDELLGERSVDFCLLFSSIASVLGGLQFVAYSAANNFIDAFVHRRNRCTSQPWLALNWDLLNPEDTAAAFRRLLGLGRLDQVVVSRGGRLSRRLDRWIGRESLDEESQPVTSGQETGTGLARPDLPTPYAAAESELQQSLVDIFRRLFGFDKIGIRDDFFELGGDSLKAITVIYRIHKSLRTEIPLPEFFKRRTVERLADYIAAAEKSAYAPIQPVEEREYYPLSPAQRRFYFLQQMDIDSTAYNIISVLHLEGRLEKQNFERSFAALIHRHDSLRTSFLPAAGEPCQRVYPRVRFGIEYTEPAGGPDGTAEQIDRFVSPFDLSRPPLLRVGLVRTAESRHILMFEMHHIISDGVSMEILSRDFMALYGAGSLPRLRLRYKDYCHWLERAEGRRRWAEQQAYWLQTFAGDIPVLHLPTDYERPEIQRFDGGSLEFNIDGSKTAGLKALSPYAGGGVTVYMTLLALYNILLSKLSSQEDIVVGTPAAGRHHADLEGIIGVFLNMLALRNEPTADKPFLTFLKEVRQNTLGAFANQAYPFEELVEKLNLRRDMSRKPLFDVLFVFQNMEIPDLKMAGLTLAPYEYEKTTAKADISLMMMEAGEGFFGKIQYSTHLFRRNTVQRFVGYFLNIVGEVVKAPGEKIGAIEWLPREEKRQILEDFNRTAADFPCLTIHQLFDRQAARSPDRIAVVDGGTALSYRAFAGRAERLARLLRQKGVGPNVIAAIAAPRSMAVIVAMMAVLKAGGAYLIIDPLYPAERTRYMLADSAAAVLLTADAVKERLPKEVLRQRQTIRLDDYDTGDCRAEELNPAHVNRPGDLVHVIYTSGSTGGPKGVMIEHRSLVNFVFHLHGDIYVHFGARLKLAVAASFAFAGSAKQIFPSLLFGHTLAIVPEAARFDGRLLLDFFDRHAVDISDGTPAHIKLMIQAFLSRPVKRSPLKHMNISADTLSKQLVEAFLDTLEAPQPVIYNMYGPTECCVDVTAYAVDPAALGAFRSVPIGPPMANSRIYILNHGQEIKPIGVRGELCVSGQGLARGYLNQPERSAGQFPPNPFETGERLYRSGDLACFLADGNIEFFGRRDNQVQVRGFRVEPVEVESQLLAHRDIKEAVVLGRGDDAGERYLCAFIVLQAVPGRAPSHKALREFLSHSLPDYMIPSLFLAVDHIPLKASGKIDRAALERMGKAIESGMVYRAPANELERELAAMWRRLLKREKVGVQDDFFDLGGHSLAAMRLAGEIFQTFHIPIGVVQLFKTPTIEGIAGYITDRQKKPGSAPGEEAVVLLTPRAPKNIFFFPPIIGYGLGYRDLAHRLNGYAVYAFNFLEEDDRLRRYVDLITGIQAAGPYILFGYSAGGCLAFEVAGEMERQGLRVSDIIMMDTFRRSHRDYDEGKMVEYEQFRRFLKEGMAGYGIDYLEKRVMAKTGKFKHYILDLAGSQPVQANIHLLAAASDRRREGPLPHGWHRLTRGSYLTYDAGGRHVEMLNPGYLEENAAIVNRVLAAIEERQAGTEKK